MDQEDMERMVNKADRQLFIKDPNTGCLVALGEPAGKPIKYCRMVPVNLTIYHDEDLEVRQKHGIAAERRNNIQATFCPKI